MSFVTGNVFLTRKYNWYIATNSVCEQPLIVTALYYSSYIAIVHVYTLKIYVLRFCGGIVVRCVA